MSAELSAFFGALGPMLRARVDAVEVERALGPSPSGTAALAFYAELVARNYRKIVRDIFPCTRALVEKLGASWSTLERAYVHEHVAQGIDPNGYGAGFPAWLQTRDGLPASCGEVADFEWLRVRAHHAIDGLDDGFERRLFVRQYTCDAPAFWRACARDPATPPPPTRPTIALVFRHTQTLQVAVHYPRGAAIAALARRQGLPLPEVLAAIDPASIDEAERVLVRDGVLTDARKEGPR